MSLARSQTLVSIPGASPLTVQTSNGCTGIIGMRDDGAPSISLSMSLFLSVSIGACIYIRGYAGCSHLGTR